MKSLREICTAVRKLDLHEPEHRSKAFKTASSTGLVGMLATEHLPHTGALILLGLFCAAVHTIFWIWSD